MQQRGSCRCAVSLCPFVCLSVSDSRVFCRKEYTYLQNFSPSSSHAILIFHTKRYGNIPTGTAKCEKNGDFRPTSGFVIDHCWTFACQHFNGASSVSRDQQTPPGHASVNLVYVDVTPKTTEHNLIVRIGKSEAKIISSLIIEERAI